MPIMTYTTSIAVEKGAMEWIALGRFPFFV